MKSRVPQKKERKEQEQKKIEDRDKEVQSGGRKQNTQRNRRHGNRSNERVKKNPHTRFLFKKIEKSTLGPPPVVSGSRARDTFESPGRRKSSKRKKNGASPHERARRRALRNKTRSKA